MEWGEVGYLLGILSRFYNADKYSVCLFYPDQKPITLEKHAELHPVYS